MRGAVQHSRPGRSAGSRGATAPLAWVVVPPASPTLDRHSTKIDHRPARIRAQSCIRYCSLLLAHPLPPPTSLGSWQSAHVSTFVVSSTGPYFNHNSPRWRIMTTGADKSVPVVDVGPLGCVPGGRGGGAGAAGVG